jgi:ABC-type Co2+ transport system permease subunit
MLKFMYVILLFGAVIFALYEQSKPAPNKFIMIGAMAFFMIGLFRIMKKIPNKNEEDNE